jgi:iron complex outermembrane receptor protein
VDLFHHTTLPARQDLVWGLGARSTPDRFMQTIPTLDFQPHRRVIGVYSAFLQDTFAVTPDKLSMTAGIKLEHNTYTGLEFMPSARLLWTPSPRHTFWAAVTRAVRTPSRIEEDFRLTLLLQPAPLTYLELDGNKNFKAERLLGYEAGFRALLAPALYLDVAGFHNDYADLQSFGSTSASVTVDATPAPPHVTFHLPYVNEILGNTDGVEVAVDWKPHRRWNAKASYSYLNFDLRQTPGTSDVLQTLAQDEGSSPKHQALLHSQIDLPGRLEFDQVIRHVSGLKARSVPAYTTADLRLAWRFSTALEFSIVGQNLLQPHHSEFGHDPGPNVKMPRSVYAKLNWTP